ncbi:MAG TPA: S1/P1 nuclease, partial [Terriglobales bacterium]|nr:S1/P1 nuclease [Terriglobales bacterium]
MMVLVCCAAAAPAWGWGCAGHQVVALIAVAHLRPEVAAQVARILATAPPGATRHPCPASSAWPAMARQANWADAARTAATAGFHFVNLPLDAGRGPAALAAACDGGCLTTAITRFAPQLAAPQAAQRATALRYLIHLTADAFQPLHTADDRDRGGNCVRTRLSGRKRAANLHQDWDSLLLRGAMGRATPLVYAQRLDRRFGARFRGEPTDPAAWVWSSHALAARTAYGPLHLQPGCEEQPVSLSPGYVRDAQ